MSKVAAIQAAFVSGDAEALEDLIHDDYQFIPHVGGMVMGCLLYTLTLPTILLV